MMPGEPHRLEALRDYRVLDSAPEPGFDSLVQLAARLCHVPIALVSLVDEHRQWFKARLGFDASETPIEVSFCQHAVAADQTLVIEDARTDPRFADNPLVTGPLGIRFYCGVVLRSPDGHGLGTLCVIDQVPRTLDAEQLASLRDIARQAEAELELRRRLVLTDEALARQRRAQAGRERLAAMLVHDLRNPITTMLLIASTLDTASERAREARVDLLAEIDRARRMLNDVLDLSLHELGELRPRRRLIDVIELIHAAAHRLVRRAAQRGQRLEVETRDGLLEVDADPEMLGRVLDNLISNAIAHGPPRVPITIAARRDGDRVRIEVRDRGAPIAPEVTERIFAPFASEPTPQGEGTAGHRGLGLAFCRLATEVHGGTIGVTPSADGNCFHVTLPRLGPPRC